MKNFNNESIEWSRVWREQAATDTERVLLIGDSIIDGSKSYIGKNLAPTLAITAYITSKGLNNPYFIKELALTVEQEDFNYKAIYLNSGLHFHGQSAQEYKQNYKKLISEIREMLPDATIILGTSTPWTVGTSALAKEYEAPLTVNAEVSFHERNQTVIAYNEKVFEIAKEESLPVFDAYTLMLENTAYKAPDGVHFKPEGYALLSEKIANALKEIIK